jgi:hypothetical protein
MKRHRRTPLRVAAYILGLASVVMVGASNRAPGSSDSYSSPEASRCPREGCGGELVARDGMLRCSKCHRAQVAEATDAAGDAQSGTGQGSATETG